VKEKSLDKKKTDKNDKNDRESPLTARRTPAAKGTAYLAKDLAQELLKRKIIPPTNPATLPRNARARRLKNETSI